MAASGLEIEIVASTSGTTLMGDKQQKEGQYATCKYRWSKTVPTGSSDVKFYSSYSKENAVDLKWDRVNLAFFSDEIDVPCGDGLLGEVVVEGQRFPVEEFSVRVYTFEIDLYVRDDFIEDEVEADQTLREVTHVSEHLQNGDIDLYKDLRDSALKLGKMNGDDKSSETGIKMSGKYEALVRQQLQKDTLQLKGFDDNRERSPPRVHSEHSRHSSGRKTPEAEKFDDSLNDLEADLKRIKRDSGSQHREMNGSTGRYDDDFKDAPLRTSELSHHSSARNTPQREFGDLDKDGGMLIHSGSYTDILNRHPSYEEGQRFREEDHPGSIHGSTHGSVHGSQHGSLHDSFHGSLHGSRPGSTRGSDHGPVHGSTHGSVHGGSTHGSVHGGSTHGSVHGSRPGSTQSSDHGPVHGSTHGSVHGSTHESDHGSRPGSTHGSVSGSRPDSTHGSVHGSTHGSVHGSIQGSDHGSRPGSVHGSIHGSAHGSLPASTHGSVHGSRPGSVHDFTHGSAHGSTHSSFHGSTHGSNLGSRPGSVHDSTRGSVCGSTHDSVHDSTHGSRPDSVHGSNHGSLPASTHGSVHGSRPSSTHGSRPGSTHGSLPNSIHYSIHGSLPGSTHGSVHGSGRSTPQRDVLISDAYRDGREKLYSDQELHYGSDRRSVDGGSAQGSRHGSRPDSIASEQELGQYFEQNSRRGSDRTVDRPSSRNGSRPPSLGGYIRQSPVPFTDGAPSYARPSSTSSFPQVSTPPRRDHRDYRSLTPDTYSHLTQSSSQPIVRGPLVTTRTAPLSSSSTSSKNSSRTTTPVPAGQENGHHEDFAGRIRDLEDTVAQLRKCSRDKEMENHRLVDELTDLKARNGSLQDEIEHLRSRSPAVQHMGNSTEAERNYSQLLNEKEILAVEVVKLRDQLDQVSRDRPSSSTSSTSPSSISSYDPNNPKTLHRKIRDLESQIQDLQEANECAVIKLSEAEKKMEELAAENASLKTASSLSIDDLESENKALRQQVSRLTAAPHHGRGDDYHAQVELRQLQDDLRTVRDRNYRLNEENIRLRESSGRLVDATEKIHDHRDLQSSLRNGDLVQPSSHSFSTSASKARSEGSGLDRAGLDQIVLDRTRLTQSTMRYNVHERDFVLETSRDQVTDFSKTLPLIDKYSPNRQLGDQLAYDKEYLRQSLDRQQITDHKSSSYTNSDQVSSPPRGQDKTLEKERSQSPYVTPERRRTTSVTSPGHGREHRWSRLTDDDLSSVVSEFSDSTTALMDVRPYRSKHPPSQQSSHTLIDDVLVKDMGTSNPAQKPTTIAYDLDQLSDAETDILLAEPSQFLSMPLPGDWGRGRRSSIESGGSGDSLMTSDFEAGIKKTLNRRSQSLDHRRTARHQRTPSPPSSHRRSDSRRPISTRASTKLSPQLHPSASVGLRSVSPPPIATQHNKHTISRSTGNISSSGSHGLQPYAPSTPGDIQIDDIVKFSRQGGKISRGRVKYLGHLPGRGDIYLGVELEKDDGKHDGIFEGVRYFKCKPNKGVFVAFNKIVMAWTCG